MSKEQAPSESDDSIDDFISSRMLQVLVIRANFPRHVRLAYQPPASSTFLSEQTSHQQQISSTFLLEQTSTNHQPPAKRTGCLSPLSTDSTCK
jgi:hypothetical protein